MERILQFVYLVCL